MPRGRRKESTDTVTQSVASAEQLGGDVVPHGDAFEGSASSTGDPGAFPPPEAPLLSAPSVTTSVNGDTSEGSGDTDESQRTWVSKLPDPHSRHGINLGDGRTAHFGRSNQFQQVHIFITAPEGVDPRPSKEDTQFLKDHGFRWRGGEQAWSKQLLSPDDKAEIEAIKAEHGEHEAARERSKRRGNADAEAQAVFVTLANTIRGRNGQEPIDYTVAEQRER